MLALDWAKVIASIGFVVLSVMIYRSVEKAGKGAMNSFQLNHEKVIQEYRVMLYANILMMSTMALYLLSGLLSNPLLIYAGKAFYTIYIIIIAVILYRWVTRFQ